MNFIENKKVFLIDALHIFVLSSFAFAQPLFDLLSQQAEFFVAHRTEPIDVFLLIVVLCVLIPFIIILFEALVGLYSKSARSVLHLIIFFILLACIVLPALNKIDIFSGITLLSLATIIALISSFIYLRFQNIKIFITILSPAIIIFPTVFLMNSAIHKIIFPPYNNSSLSINVKDAPPIIMIIFDEFPVFSLLDHKYMIDPIRYPNFAELANKSFWFRNTSTVSGNTLMSVTSILTGLKPNKSLLPTNDDYPLNLFTILDNSYKMKVFETHTMLCPSKICKNEETKQTSIQRIFSLISDLSIVTFHIILPSDFTHLLPPITQNWTDFNKKVNISNSESIISKKQSPIKRTPAHLFSEFVESVNYSEEPTLYFIHSVLPHVPWKYLPSGKLYTLKGADIPGLNIKDEQWGNDTSLVVKGYQRHLLQVGFVDKLLGDLMNKLKILNLYDQSLIIITADHGVNFIANESRRAVLKNDPFSIKGVPLIIKAPRQSAGVIYDHYVNTIDILPTIADMIQIQLPIETDGKSALDSKMLDNFQKKTSSNNREFYFADSLSDKNNGINRKLALFGEGMTPHGLFKIGPHSELVNRHLNKVKVVEDIIGVAAQLDQEYLFADVDLDASLVPAYITGRLINSERKNKPLNLAVAINGRIHGVTRAFNNDGELQFSVMVPETAFQKGKNRVEVFLVSEDRGQLKLTRTNKGSTVTYSLAQSEEYGNIITSSTGILAPVIKNALNGHLDIAEIKDNNVLFSGWAADVKRSQLPDAIVIFVNGKFFYLGYTNLGRPDIVKAFDNIALTKAGFQYYFPLSMFNDMSNTEIRIFAISKENQATELIYPKGYNWNSKS